MPSEYAKEQLQELTDKLEQGVSELFASGRYADYLQTMSKFHQYSFGNVLLILMQCPHASQVAGFNTWKKDFGRSVKRGEKGIKILAPCPYKMFVEQDKLDPATHRPVLDNSGRPVKETVLLQKARFRVVSVFDVFQTEGKELPTLAVSELTGSVANYDALMEKLITLSPVPVAFEPISGTAKGCFNQLEQRIVVRPGMSETQTIKTLVHEVAHALLHNRMPDEVCTQEEQQKDRRTREVEAESVAYVVCQHFGIDTSDYSFGYVAGWSKDKELPELKSSLDCIRSTAAQLIDGMEGREQSREQQQTQTIHRRDGSVRVR